MGYVSSLLKGKLIMHQEFYERCKRSNDNVNAEGSIKVISEIEYVLSLLEHSETYQKY